MCYFHAAKIQSRTVVIDASLLPLQQKFRFPSLLLVANVKATNLRWEWRVQQNSAPNWKFELRDGEQGTLQLAILFAKRVIC